MNRRAFSPSVSLWLLIGLACLALPGRPQAQEPRHQGRTFAEWQGDLGNQSPAVRQQAVHALVHFGPVAVRPLISRLRDVSVQVRHAAAFALGNMGPAAEDAVPALARALEDMDVQVRQTAAWALAAIGPAAKDAVPELIRAVRDSNRVVQANAAQALGAIGPAAKDASLVLAQALYGAHTYMWGNVASALKAIGPAAIDELRRELESDPELQPVVEQAIHVIEDR